MNTEHFKQKLEEEKARLEGELGAIGANKTDDNWEARNTIDADTAEDTEVADKFEELEINEGIVSTLEIQLKDVDDALDKIESGSYGKCETCNEQIEEDRLEANPSARTCKAHMN